MSNNNFKFGKYLSISFINFISISIFCLCSVFGECVFEISTFSD